MSSSKTKKKRMRTHRYTSNVFSMFNQAQIQEFKVFRIFTLQCHVALCHVYERYPIWSCYVHYAIWSCYVHYAIWSCYVHYASWSYYANYPIWSCYVSYAITSCYVHYAIWSCYVRCAIWSCLLSHLVILRTLY